MIYYYFCIIQRSTINNQENYNDKIYKTKWEKNSKKTP